MPESNMTAPAPGRERCSAALWAVRYGMASRWCLAAS